MNWEFSKPKTNIHFALFVLILIFPALFFFPLSVHTQTFKYYYPLVSSPINIILAWDPNSEPDLAGYKLYVGKVSRKYTQVRDLGMVNQYKVSIPKDKTPFYFAITAYNHQGLESGFSNEVCFR